MVTPERLIQIVEQLRQQESDDTLVEAKRCSQALSRDVWETVSAFANTSGGLIILGLEEATGFSPAPSFDPDRVRDQFVSGIGDGGAPALVSPAPRYQMSRGVVDGAPVVLIEIEELDLRYKPCYIVARGIQAGSYKRVDDKDVRLSPAELFEMQSVLVPSDADGGVVAEATVSDLDDELVSTVIATCRNRSPRMLRGVETREDQMNRLNITNKEGGVRLAGLLACGLYPQQYYPKLVVDVASHPGAEKAAPGAPRFLDRQICDGPLSACIEDALAVVGRNLRKTSYVEGAGRRDEWEVPEEVLREAITNAVIHREYSPLFQGESVSVDIFPDRIEISNPGGLWGGKTLDTLEDGLSRCRNAKLMTLMGLVPLDRAPGNVAESQGSGIPAMIREMESRSLGRPQFIARGDSFKVILARHGVELERNRSRLSSRTSRALGRKEETVLMLLREQGRPLMVKEMRRLLGWDSDEIRAHCQRLTAEGLIAEVSEDRYELSGDGATRARVAPRTTRLKDQILEAMTPGQEKSARELADELSVPVSRIRRVLPELIEGGRIAATADPHSRNRKYRLMP